MLSVNALSGSYKEVSVAIYLGTLQDGKQLPTGHVEKEDLK